MKSFFDIQKRDKKTHARAGVIHTLHGDLETPALMIVGTKANVKQITPAQLHEIGVPVVLCNTYHLYLLPGPDLVAQMGGLHGFMNWDGPIFTDSGGFQIFSMGHGMSSDEIKGRERRHRKKSMLKLEEDGATFKSYIDGSMHVLTPEKSIQIQHKLGADMIAVLDECTPYHVDKNYTRESMELTHRWLLRCQEEHKRLKSKQALFGIIQGGVYPDLRKISTDFIAKSDTPGVCVGGCLGKDKDEMFEVIAPVMRQLPEEKPVHLLGIGDLEDLVRGVAEGIDTFDCVTPTRNARHGLLFCKNAKDHRMRITNAEFRNDSLPIDPECGCYVCKNFSRAYVHYLLRANEHLGTELCTYHNIYFITNFMKQMRQSILDGSFDSFREEWGL